MFSMWSSPCPLLSNGSLNTSAEGKTRKNRTSLARQRPQYAGNSRTTSVVMQRALDTTIEEVFSILVLYIHCLATVVVYDVTWRLYKWYRTESRVEAGWNTSTVALRVVGGDNKGSLKSGTVKYGRESHGTGPREWMRWRRPAAIVNYRPILSSERMLYKVYDRRCLIKKKKSGRESQVVRRQDELLDGMPPVVK
jgi:hypothetical protein